ncbi:hypothetical protein ACFQ3Y_08955 [Paenibacillus motobuensis]|uniref:hypothetical protein n=1 Tax=Paenibacillus motobuensis TaxID=295324 RepID=UPI0036428B4B
MTENSRNDRDIRKTTKKVSRRFRKTRILPGVDTFYLYNGALESYEDPADYVRVKGGRIA